MVRMLLDLRERRRLGGAPWLRAAVGDGARLAAFALCLVLAGTRAAVGQARSAATIQQDVTLAADAVKVWKEGTIRYFLLEGKCFLEQSLERVRADECLAWMDEQSTDRGEPTRVHVLCRGNVRIQEGRDSPRTPVEYRRVFETKGEVRLQTKDRRNVSAADHPLYKEVAKEPPAAPPSDPDVVVAGGTSSSDAKDGVVPAVAAAASESSGEVIQAQFAPGPSAGDGPAFRRQGRRRGGGIAGGVNAIADSGGRRRISVTPRSSQPYHSDSSVTPDGQRITIFTGGINLIVEDLGTGQVVDIVADRVVLWTKGDLASPTREGGADADSRQPIEVYLEGNVFIRQGNPRLADGAASVVLAAKQAYYNVNTNQALAIDADVETVDPKTRLPLFLRSEEVRQLTPEKFFARRASITTSPYRGTPGYDFFANQAYFEEVKERIRNPFTGQDVVDPATGVPRERVRHFVTGYNDVLRVQGVPVFYWPYLRLDVEDPLGPLQEIRLGSSNNLGFISAVALDLWELLGLDYLDIAERSNWLADIGYFSRRGISGGSRLNYFGGEPGVNGYYGNLLGWGIDDHGLDYLGPGRNGIAPPSTSRGRARLQHRHELPNDFTLQLETSYLSDPNFLESLYEVEYDTGKDQDTLAYLKQQRNQWAWSLLLQPRINNFLPQNPWLPRADHYLLGASLFGNRVTYFEHTSVAYAELRPPNQYNLPIDVTLNTGRLDTRHELDLPTQLGAWQVTPFVLGEFSGYTDAIDTTTNTPTGDPLGRIYGAAGVRTSLPFWRIYPNARSELFNVSGLAHKVSLDLDYIYSLSNQFYRELPYLDQADDDTSDLVRRQNLLRDQAVLLAQFGTITPVRYDPRNYANRLGVTWLPEALDDLQAFRVGINQALQTKRGPAGKQHILDWMVLDAGLSIFPQRDRDNFGEYVGLVNYFYQWNIGDRTSLTSSLLYEPSEDTYSIDGAINFQRPPRSMFSLFTSNFNSGPFISNYVGGSTSYRFSQKYAGSISVGTDLQAALAPSLTAGFTRIGLDFITSLGVVYNAGRGDFGFQFEIYPRVAGRTRYNRSRLQTLPFGVDATDSPTPIVADRLSILNNNFTPY